MGKSKKSTKKTYSKSPSAGGHGNAPKKGFAYTPEKVDMKDVQGMLNETYNKDAKDVGSYKLDKQLSNKRVKVYHDPVSNKVVVAHRGSQDAQDWKENAMYTLGIKKGKGWNTSKEIQKKAEHKYAGAHLTTTGHSKGALHAQEFGQKGDIVTVNKPVNVGDAMHKKVGENQTDIKSRRDPVSFLRHFQKGKKAKVQTSHSWNPLKNHSVDYTMRDIK